MANQTTFLKFEKFPKTIAKQACVKATFNNSLSLKLRKEAYKFISRNIIPDCQRVAPNCLKAHLIKTATKLKLSKNKLDNIKNLFKSKIGYKGYYLDSGKLKHI